MPPQLTPANHVLAGEAYTEPFAPATHYLQENRTHDSEFER